MRVAVLLLLMACEKSGPVETASTGSSAPAVAPAIVKSDGAAGTTPNDAAVAVADAAPADAAVASVPDAGRRARDRDAIDLARLEAQALAIADKLTVADPAVDAGDMSRRRPGADLGKQIEDVRESGKTVSIGGGGGSRGGRVGTGGGLGTGGAAIDSSGGPKANTPSGRITITSKQAYDETTLTPDAVVAKLMSAYLAGIKRCYRSYLDKDATARGKIVLSITVNESGRSVGSKASGFASQIDDCVTGLMGYWTFPRPLDRDGEPTTASFDIKLQLVPD